MTSGELLTVPELVPRSSDDRDPAARLRAGDSAAFEELFRRGYEKLVAYATRILGAPDVAEEVVQDVFLSIWQNRERGDFAAENVSAYLTRAVRNRSMSRLRHVHVERRWRERISRGGKVPMIAPSPAPGADAEVRSNELIRAVQVAIDELPPRSRKAFLLRRQHGLSYVEIAQVMGIATKTVEVHIGAALRTLRERLAYFYES